MKFDKHLAEHALLETLPQQGCAICRLTAKAADGWIDTLLREGITNVTTRLGFRASGGLCARHGEHLIARGNPLGVATLYQDLLSQAPPFAGKAPPQRRCPLCRHTSEVGSLYAGVLAGLLDRDDVWEALRGPGAPCVPHGWELVKQSPRQRRNAVRQALAERAALLEAELQEVIRKHDYRYQDEGWGAEADAWSRGVRFWSGQEGEAAP
jgi:hypothetical protein